MFHLDEHSDFTAGQKALAVLSTLHNIGTGVSTGKVNFYQHPASFVAISWPGAHCEMNGTINTARLCCINSTLGNHYINIFKFRLHLISHKN